MKEGESCEVNEMYYGRLFSFDTDFSGWRRGQGNQSPSLKWPEWNAFEIECLLLGQGRQTSHQQKENDSLQI